MSESSLLAHHFNSFEQQHQAGTLGMWVFIAQECLFFGGLFLGYTFYRVAYPEAFAAGSAALDIPLGTVNTAVLLGSSFSMALSVSAARSGRPLAIVLGLTVTWILGAVFLAIKAVEYSDKFSHHLVPGHGFTFAGDQAPQVELFFGFYFVMTGLHAVHMVIGMGIIPFIMRAALRGRITPRRYAAVENIGLYWHFVDLVWIGLFAMIYFLK